MKKVIKFILIFSFVFSILTGCDKKEIMLEPVDENAMVEYLKGKDPVLENDDFTGTYKIVSRTCDKKTDDLVVSYNGSSALFDYEARYQVKSTATKDGWVIESFDIVDSKYEIKEITPSMLKTLLEGVDKNVTDGTSGTYYLLNCEVKDNTVIFLVRYRSDDGKYDAEYDGVAIVKDGKLQLDRVVINDVSSGESDDGEGETPDDSGETTLSNNYDPNKKAADYGYKAPTKQKFNDLEQDVAYFIGDIKPGHDVTKVEYLCKYNSSYEFNVTHEKKYKYVKDVYVQHFVLKKDGDSFTVTWDLMLDSYVNSNFEGVYVNKANGSYIIMHENWKFELYEFYLDNGTIKNIVLKEYYRISNTSMKWQNRKKVFKSLWTDGTEPEYFAVTILSINELRLDANILSSKSGDKFVRVAE